jgi:hypothetical protein
LQHRFFAPERAADGAVVATEVSGDLVQAVAMKAVSGCDRSLLGGKDFREGTTKRLQLSTGHLEQHFVVA